jgi:predicted outer membrane repeat protein
VFEIATQVTISEVTVQKGRVFGRGGGIFSVGTLTLINSTVSGNSTAGYARDGGGIFSAGTLTLTNSTVSDNFSGLYGGGIYSAGTLTLTNSTVSGNLAHYHAGGIAIRGGTATLTNSTVSDNAASTYGGGIENLFSALTLVNSTVSGNFAAYGAGIRNSNGGLLTLTNTTVSGNYGGYSGRSAGIAEYSANPLTLINSTVTENGSGIWQRGNPAEITNSIIASNGNRNCNEPLASNGHNLSDDTSCFAAAGTDLVAPAQLGALADNGGPTLTHLPLSGSPAIDAGDNTNCPTTDQRGAPRPVDGDDPPDGFADCDIGAVEAPGPTASATATATATPTTTPTPTAACELLWPVHTVTTFGKGQSPSNNAKVESFITGNIIDPASLRDTAHRIPVCFGTRVVITVTDTTGTPALSANSSGITCAGSECTAETIRATQKYIARASDGTDTDRMTLLAR